MIDFVKEIEKYQPILKVSDVGETINGDEDEVKDIMDLFDEIVKGIKKKNEESREV